jgi:lipopolysaccharide biosynthesis glycosyltransferase
VIRWFIGWDKDEGIASYVLEHSIQTKSSIPISFTHLNRDSLRGLFKRKRSETESTDFSISRFLVPYLCNYEGWAVFSDCDMVVNDDVSKLWAWRDDRYSVRVVKHNYEPVEQVKFLGRQQLKYEKKNWSSVILFNNEKCKSLTKDYVTHASGLDLHQFKWTTEEQIGDLPSYWNHLVGHDPKDDKASLLHYTTGGPYFQEYQDCEYSSEWFETLKDMQKINE